MKYIFPIITLLLFSCQTIFAQATVDDLKNDSAKLYVEYADYQGYVNDSIYSSLGQSFLYLGKNAAVYIYQTKSPQEFEKSMRERFVVTKGKVDLDEMINSFKKKYDLEKMVSEVFVRYYSSPDYLHLKSRDDGDVWVSDTVVFNWKPVKEFKAIGGYRCQKATYIGSGGDEVTAWFTEEIPFSVGPSPLSGLPGLIMEYHNPKSKRFFKATTISSTNIPEQNFRKWLSGPIVSKAEYSVIYADGLKKFQQFKRMLDNEKSTKQ
jgi:GLPGLI family protein